jgi:hypothetical protein|tara:strand:+ start:1715 stop:2440 length:726 start_codon:yes stop_codon:yes gene_type:complete
MGGFGKFNKRKPDSGEVDNYLHLRNERTNAPAAPGDGDGGYLYTKSDGKPYWISNDHAEISLLLGASGVDKQIQFNDDGEQAGASDMVYNTGNGYLGMGASGADVTHRLTLPNVSGVGGRVKANAYVTYSSQRYKGEIKNIPDPINLLNKLNGVTYEWNDSKRTDIGFIAEDVGKVIPCIVDYEENGVDAIAMDYSRINAVLVEAVKEQNKIINNLVDIVGTFTDSQKVKFNEISGLLKKI